MARRKKQNFKLQTGLKFFIIGVFTIFFFYIICQQTVYFFYHADVFNIAEIVKSPSLQFVDSRHLRRLEGKNIFLVDLKGLQKRLQSEYSSIDRLRILRQLPNRIIVTAEKRMPFIVAAVGPEDVVLDERGIVLEGEIPAYGVLPYLSGVNDVSSVKKGHKVSSAQIRTGLAIVREITGNIYLKKFSVKSIDLSNLSKIYMHLDRIEVILDQSKISEKVETLGFLLSDAGVPLDQINYLDLRFKEPVINKK